jgi:hypothetical protein
MQKIGDKIVYNNIKETLAVEAYRNKLVPLISTPRAPGSLFDKIEFHKPDTPYHKIWLLYQNGLGTMFSPEQIERERRQPYFDREYCGIYTGGVGNVFSTESIDAATKIQYDQLSIIPLAPESASWIGMVIMVKRFAWVMPSRTDT